VLSILLPQKKSIQLMDGKKLRPLQWGPQIFPKPSLHKKLPNKNLKYLWGKKIQNLPNLKMWLPWGLWGYADQERSTMTMLFLEQRYFNRTMAGIILAPNGRWPIFKHRVFHFLTWWGYRKDFGASLMGNAPLWRCCSWGNAILIGRWLGLFTRQMKGDPFSNIVLLLSEPP